MVRLRIFDNENSLTERLAITATDLGNKVSMARNRISDYAFRTSDKIIHKTKVHLLIGMTILNTAAYSFIGYHAINDSLDEIGMSKESLKKAGIVFGGTAAVCSLPISIYGLVRLRDRYRRSSDESYSMENSA